MIRTVLASAILLISPSAMTGDTTARVERVLLWSDGNMVYVYPAGGVVNPPACHGSNGDYYSFSMSRPMAKEYLGALLSAQARGVNVFFIGTGTCSDQSVSETLSYFRIEE